MLICVKHYGQLCNRLWALTPVIAYALHKKRHLYVCFARKSYLNCFPMLKNCKYLHFVLSHDGSFYNSIEWRLALYSEKWNLEVKGDFATLKKIGLFSFVDGWQHGEDISFVREQKEKIVELFKPTNIVANAVSESFKGFDGITIGVHVRRGDYKDYLGGKYYYSDDVYYRIMNRIRQLFALTNQKVRFLICSNEPFEVLQEDNDVFTIQGADGITDLYALSKCNYIIGPPSSYSQWASFIGDVPLCLLLSETMDISMESFLRIVLFNTFENGKKIKLSNITDSYYIE